MSDTLDSTFALYTEDYEDAERGVAVRNGVFVITDEHKLAAVQQREHEARQAEVREHEEHARIHDLVLNS